MTRLRVCLSNRLRFENKIWKCMCEHKIYYSHRESISVSGFEERSRIFLDRRTIAYVLQPVRQEIEETEELLLIFCHTSCQTMKWWWECAC